MCTTSTANGVHGVPQSIRIDNLDDLIIEDEATQPPPGCSDAFGLARDEAKLLLKDITDRFGCVAFDISDVYSDDGWSIKEALAPAQDEASIIREEVESWIEDYQPVIDQAKENVRSTGQALGSGAVKAVEPLTLGVAAAIEPAAEEARLLVTEMSSRSTRPLV